MDVSFHTICRKLDNSVAVLILNVPYTLGVFLAAKQSPWFIVLSALCALLFTPYLLGVARLIWRAGDQLGRMLAVLTVLAFTMVVVWGMLGTLLSWPFWLFLICWPVMILLECCGLSHANNVRKKTRS